MGRGKPEPICWDCGAPNAPGSSECWLCQRRDWNRYPAPRRRRPPPPNLPRRGPLSTIAGLMIWTAIVGVSMSVFVLAPPLGIVLVAAFVPALIVTEVKASGRRRRGEPMSGWERASWVLGLMILFPILLVALAIALFALCFLFVR